MTLTGIGGGDQRARRMRRPRARGRCPGSFYEPSALLGTFVAGLDPHEFYNEAIKPKLGPIGTLLRYEVDREQREVRTSLAGLLSSRAVHDGPFGCRVLHTGREARFFQGEAGDREPLVVSPSSIAGPGTVTPVNDKLSQALDHAFAESESGPRRAPRPSWCCIAAASSANAMHQASRRRRP